jgi:hypothetical protein
MNVTSWFVARLDRKRLGQDILRSKWNSIRGVFDKQTRRKPLVFAVARLSGTVFTLNKVLSSIESFPFAVCASGLIRALVIH